MNAADAHYPAEKCPFCTIGSAYPFPAESSPVLWERKNEHGGDSLGKCVPGEEEIDVERTEPGSFVVLRSRDVVAFLDILPMVGGEF
jgi:hypothetical protein